MNAQAILDDLIARGVLLCAEGDSIKIDAPRGSLTAEDLARLTEHKAAIIATLTPNPGDCLQCSKPMLLQDRAGDAWWCPTCRLWVIAGVIQSQINRLNREKDRLW